MAYNTFTEEELQHLSKLASSGDSTAKDMLLSEAKRITKAANSRLLSLEKKGFVSQSYAYGMAEIWNDDRIRNRFKANNNMTVEQLTSELRRARVFMSQESSTTRGVIYARQRFFETLEAYDIVVPESSQTQFYEFIRSDSVQDVIDYIGEYDIIMDIISNNLDDITNSFRNLQRQFDMAVANRENFDEFIERMSGGKSFAEMYKRHTKRESEIRDRRRKSKNNIK